MQKNIELFTESHVNEIHNKTPKTLRPTESIFFIHTLLCVDIINGIYAQCYCSFFCSFRTKCKCEHFNGKWQLFNSVMRDDSQKMTRIWQILIHRTFYSISIEMTWDSIEVIQNQLVAPTTTTATITNTQVLTTCWIYL